MVDYEDRKRYVMERIEDWISKNGRKPIYVLAGENAYERQENFRGLLAQIRHEHDVENLPDTESLEDLLESANMLSMFGTGKIVVQRNPLWLKKTEDLEPLMQWAENPTPDVVIVLGWEQNPDKRKKSFKWFVKRGYLIACDNLKSWELPAWIQKRFKERGKRVSLQGAQALLALVGESQMLLDGEIEKICLYAGKEKEISIETIERLSSATAEAGIFDFIDSLCAAKGLEALAKLDNLIKMKEPEVKICFMIARQFRILLQGKQLKRSGVHRQDIAGRMKVNPYVWKKAEPFVDRYDEGTLEEFFFQCHKMDWDMKSGQGEPRVLLEHFILSFCAMENNQSAV